jgi:cyclopropane fatty-acyl-phospholipid synthase-like methyltransferase
VGKAKRQLDERSAILVSLCRGKKVLHIGCADWPYTEKRIREGNLLHALLHAECADVFGVDVSAVGLEMLRGAMPYFRVGYPDEIPREERWDRIVAGEVIEHVGCPEELLKGVAAYAETSTELIITTPNAYSAKGALRALVGKERQHPDHVVLFSVNTLSGLLEMTGWEVLDVDFYNARPQRGLAAVVRPLMDLFFKIVSKRARDGMVVRARRKPGERTASEVGS